MTKITIPGTNFQTSVICLGSVSLGSTLDREQSFALLDAYLEQGGSFIDTASVYANWLPIERNSSEKTIGRWLRARGTRDRVILGTKGAHPELSTMNVPRMSRAEIVHDLDTSLRNLQTDVIDLYWLHRDDPGRPVAEILETLNDQIRAGKVRAIGCSNWRAPRIREAQAYAAQHGLHGFVGDQMKWSLAAVDPHAMSDKTMAIMDDDLMAWHTQSGQAAIPYSSQAQGLFQKMAAGAEPTGARALPENRARFERVQRLARESGLSVTQIVLGYLLSHPFPVIPIVGCRTIPQLLDSLTAADVRLDPDQVRALEQG